MYFLTCLNMALGSVLLHLVVPQGYGDNKPKSSTTAQEVKTLDGIYAEQVNNQHTYILVLNAICSSKSACPESLGNTANQDRRCCDHVVSAAGGDGIRPLLDPRAGGE